MADRESEDRLGKAYSAPPITVFYDRSRCRHYAECVRGLPQVFDVTRRPWIRADLADPNSIAEVIRRCPTGALHYRLTDGNSETADEPTTITPVTRSPGERHPHHRCRAHHRCRHPADRRLTHHRKETTVTTDLTALPEPIRAYLTARENRDDDAAVRAFAPDATVTDEGQTQTGTQDIRAWRRRASTEYTYTTAVTGVRQDSDHEWVVAIHLEGNFPGRVAELEQRFTVSAGPSSTSPSPEVE